LVPRRGEPDCDVWKPANVGVAPPEERQVGEKAPDAAGGVLIGVAAALVGAERILSM